MGDEFRKGYNNPLEAESQAAKLGAWQRRQDEERAARRAAPPPPTPDYGAGQAGASAGASGGWVGSSNRGGSAGAGGRNWQAPGGIGASARTGAFFGAAAALLYLYLNHQWTIPLALVWGVGGLVAGYVAGAVLYVAVLLLRIALIVGFWLVVAYFVLYMLGVLPRDLGGVTRERAAAKVSVQTAPMPQALQLPR